MRIVGSLTTMPHRYEALYKTLQCLQAQSYKLDAIYVGLPSESKRLKIKYPEVPDKIKELCTLVQLQQDYGPVSKIFGALLRETSPDTYILSFDDDVQYAPNLVESFVTAALPPRSGEMAAYGSNGFSIGNGFPFYEAVINNNNDAEFLGFSANRIITSSTSEVDILCGFSGVLYQRKFFEDDFYGIVNAIVNAGSDGSAGDLFMNDDVLISGYLSKKGIRRFIIKTPAPQPHAVAIESDIIAANSGSNTVSVKKPIQVADTSATSTREITHISDVDKTAISYDKIKFLQRFKSAIAHGKTLGFFATTAPSSISDTVIFSIILILIFIIIFIFIIYKFMTDNRF